MHIVYVAVQLQTKNHFHTHFGVQGLQVIEDIPHDRYKEEQYCHLIFTYYHKVTGRWIFFHVYLCSNPVCKWKTLFKVTKVLRICSIACSYMIDLFHFLAKTRKQMVMIIYVIFFFWQSIHNVIWHVIHILMSCFLIKTY